MVADIRRLLKETPFAPFTIVTSSGQRYRVASPDHAGVDPKSTRMIVWLDEGGSVLLAGLHVASLEIEEHATAA
jgi:hypothetical protein